MANLIEKTFDATKRVFRTIFRGNPNLLTTNDINLALRRMNEYLVALESMTGVRSDLSFNGSVKSDGMLTIYYNISNLYAFGCHFIFTDSNKSGTLKAEDMDDEPYYLVATFVKKIVTYQNDTNHEVSGAVFSDGTNFPAADHVVLENPTFSLKLVQDITGNTDDSIQLVLGSAYYDSVTNTLVSKHNYLGSGINLSIPMSGNRRIYPSRFVGGSIAQGSSVNNAVETLNARFQLNANTINTGWQPTYTLDSDEGNTVNNLIKIGIFDGFLCVYVSNSLNIGAQDITSSVIGGPFDGYEDGSPAIYLSTINDENIISALEELNSLDITSDTNFRLGSLGIGTLGNGVEIMNTNHEDTPGIFNVDLVLKRIPRSYLISGSSSYGEFGRLIGFRGTPNRDFYWCLYALGTGGTIFRYTEGSNDTTGSIALNASTLRMWPENNHYQVKTRGGVFTFPLLILSRR